MEAVVVLKRPRGAGDALVQVWTSAVKRFSRFAAIAAYSLYEDPQSERLRCAAHAMAALMFQF